MRFFRHRPRWYFMFIFASVGHKYQPFSVGRPCSEDMRTARIFIATIRGRSVVSSPLLPKAK